MKITLKQINKDYLLEAKNDNNHTVIIDNKTIANPQGVSPMELLLMGLAGCNAIDIISVLKKKRQVIDNYRTEVISEREEGVTPAIFKTIHLTIYLEGNVTEESALRAAELSFTKYCSVSRVLEKTAEISYSIVLNGKKI